MKKTYRILLIMLLLALLAGVQVCSADKRYNYSNFNSLISQLKQDWVIPNTDGKFYTHEDYTRAYANMNRSVWNSFGDGKNFVFSMDVSWRSASETPNTFYSGCGLMFRYNGTTDYLFASLRMDGRLYLKGKRNGKDLKYGDYYYGRANIEATHNLTVIANEENVKILVDGLELANAREVAVNRGGSFGFVTLSGTNKDWGTACTFSYVNYYVW